MEINKAVRALVDRAADAVSKLREAAEALGALDAYDQKAEGPRPLNIGDLKLTGKISGQFVRENDGHSTEARFTFENGVVTVAEFGQRISDEQLQEWVEELNQDAEANGFKVAIHPLGNR